MDDATRNKLKALGKLGIGLFRIGNGVLTAAGAGILGSRLKSHHLMGSARHIGRLSIQEGQKTLAEGWKEWKEL